METFLIISTIAANLIAIGSVVFTIIAIRQTRKHFEAQLGMTKQQLTIEEWGKISTKDASFTTRQYLNRLEQFATGVKRGIYDFDTLCEMAGGNLISKYDRHRVYIEERRIKKRPTLYIEFEQLVERIKEARG